VVELHLAAELSETHAALRLCTPEAQREMERSLSRLGQLTPVVLNRTARGVEVLDGFKRVKAARALGWAVLRGEVSEVDGPGAKLRLWQCNAGSALSELEQGWLVRALYREDGLTQPRIAQLLGRHKSWVSRRLMLVEGLSDGVQADVRLGLLSATAARELGQLPRGNQDATAQVVTRRGLTARQTATLVARLREAADAGARERTLAEAMTWTSPSPRAGETPSAKLQRTPGEWLVADLAAVARLSARLHARLLERPLSSLGEAAAQVASRNLQGLRPGLLSLCQTIERVTRGREVGGAQLS
jgi:ParB-like chromosome segregation protein Spo0J